MKKISIYIRNKNINPSSYYRICQYTKDIDMHFYFRSLTSNKMYNLSLNSKYHLLKLTSKAFLYVEIIIRSCVFILLDILKKPDIIYIQREIIPKKTPTFIFKIEKKLLKKSIIIWDIDDNLLESKEISKKDFCFYREYSKYIVCSTKILSRELFDENYLKKIRIIPTTDGDINSLLNADVLKKREELYKNEIKLIWVGTTSNLEYIMDIIPILDKCAKTLKERNKKLILTIVTGYSLNVDVNHIEIKFVKWSRKQVIKEILNAHIGLMPLKETPFTIGKASFKLIQYLSAGIPVIGSPVGYNYNVITNEIGFLASSNTDWINSIVYLSSNIDEYQIYSSNALEQWNKFYSYDIQLEKILKLFEDTN